MCRGKAGGSLTRETAVTGPPRSIFISHRHEDARIADILRESIRDWGDGEIEVYQSSSPHQAPAPGSDLSTILADQLTQANVVLLVYTTEDKDWTYCMYECGLAINPRQNDTRVVVFGICGQFPAPLAHTVAVDVMNEASVTNFLKHLFKGEDFFLGGEPGAFRPRVSDEQVANYTQQLMDRLRGLVPPPFMQWPAWSYLILELSDQQHAQITGAAPDDRSAVVEEMLPHCRVVAGDATGRMFGRRMWPPDMTFGQVVEEWERLVRRHGDGTGRGWLESLAHQVERAVLGMEQDQYPDWQVIQGVRQPENPRELSFPVLQWSRRVPNGHQFDIYFIPVSRSLRAADG
jgi:hypothetical protein